MSKETKKKATQSFSDILGENKEIIEQQRKTFLDLVQEEVKSCLAKNKRLPILDKELGDIRYKLFNCFYEIDPIDGRAFPMARHPYEFEDENSAVRFLKDKYREERNHLVELRDSVKSKKEKLHYFELIEELDSKAEFCEEISALLQLRAKLKKARELLEDEIRENVVNQFIQTNRDDDYIKNLYMISIAYNGDMGRGIEEIEKEHDMRHTQSNIERLVYSIVDSKVKSELENGTQYSQESSRES